MPLAFSTLGCPTDSLEQVIDTAHAAGALGLELRSAEGQIVFPGMPAKEAQRVAERIRAEGLTILTLASYVKICRPARAGEVEAELDAALELAAGLGALYVRVFPGAGLSPKSDNGVDRAVAAADQLGAQRLNAASATAQSLGVTILLETHDSHPRGADVQRILGHVDRDAPVQVIWDLMHPWRYDESPQRTADLLAPKLAYAQYKDGIRIPGTNHVELTLPGQGELPLREMRGLVAGIGAQHGVSDPWISLEWERAWHPELPPIDQALESLKTTLR